MLYYTIRQARYSYCVKQTDIFLVMLLPVAEQRFVHLKNKAMFQQVTMMNIPAQHKKHSQDECKKPAVFIGNNTKYNSTFKELCAKTQKTLVNMLM